MYLIKRIIKSSITIVSIIVQSVIDVIRLCFYPLSLSLKLILNRRKRRQYKAHRHDNYQSQIDGINRVIKDIKLSVNTDHWYIKSALNGDRDTRLSEKIDAIDDKIHNAKIESDALSIEVKNVKDSLDWISKEGNRVSTDLNERIDWISKGGTKNHLMINSVSTDLNKRIDSANKLAEIKKFHLDDAIKQIQSLNNRVNELELCQEDSTLTIFPDNEEMTVDEHVQHAMNIHEREEGRVKEYDYHAELKAIKVKEDSVNE